MKKHLKVFLIFSVISVLNACVRHVNPESNASIVNREIDISSVPPVAASYIIDTEYSDVEQIKLPLKITRERLKAYRLRSEKVYQLMKNTFHTKGNYLVVEFSGLPYTLEVDSKSSARMNLMKMIYTSSRVMNVLSPDGGILTKLMCNEEVTATSPLGFGGNSLNRSNALNMKANDMIVYNCMASLINQVVDNLDVIESYSDIYVK